MINKLNNLVPDFLMNPRLRVYRHLVLQFVILLISINVLWDTPNEIIVTPRRLMAWIGYFLILDIMVYVNIYIAVPRYLLKDKLFAYLLSVFLMVILAVAAIVAMQSFVYNPGDLEVISETEQSVDQFQFAGLILGVLSSLLAMSLLLFGISALLLMRHWMSNNQRIDALRSATLQSELKLLKDQINPHFLFNMLNNANVLIRKKKPEASEVLFKLEDLLRYQINDSARQTVLLTSEIHFLNDFLNLEKIRRDKFEYAISKEGEISQLNLPPMLFIPFVENAVKHNSDSEKMSYVKLYFKVINNQLEFCCENSKPEVTAKKSDVGGIGLANIRRRLNLLFPDSHQLEIQDNETTYIVKLKLELDI